MTLLQPFTDDDPLNCSALSDGLRALARRGVVRSYRRKDMVLIEEGEHDDTLFIVLSGSARAYSCEDPKRRIDYHTYGPGEYFGEMNLDGGPRSASVMTLEPSTFAVVTRHTLKDHIRQCPDFGFDVIEKVIRVAREATLAARMMALTDVYGRMVYLLNSLAVVQADGRRVVPRMTHLSIANHIGSSRVMVSRLLRDLLAGEYVGFDDEGRLVIKRPLPPHH